jgi:sugar phosphate isomerase/epimerase
MPVPIALQLYSVRQECAQDFFGVLEQVAKMGYAGVEFAGYHGKSAAEIKKVLDDLGLVCEGTHTGMDAFNDENFEATVELHKTLGTTFAIIPGIAESKRNSVEACRETCAWLTELVAKLEPHGLRTGFHAHDGDMKPLENGQSAWQLIAAGTPHSFIMQYDTANGLMGGADPVQPIRDNPGRNASLHLKGWEGDHAALVGEGSIDWNAVFDAAENGGGVQWYVVEHEELEGSIEAVDKCLQNLRAMGK